MSVDTEEHVTQRRQVRWSRKCQSPRSWDSGVAGDLGVERGQVQLSEGDVPALDPGGIIEKAFSRASATAWVVR